MNTQPIPFEAAVEILVKIQPAIDAIRAEYTKLGAVRAEASKAESAAREAEDKRQTSHRECAVVEQRLVAVRRDVETLTAQVAALHEERVTEQGKLNTARDAYAALKQQLA